MSDMNGGDDPSPEPDAGTSEVDAAESEAPPPAPAEDDPASSSENASSPQTPAAEDEAEAEPEPETVPEPEAQPVDEQSEQAEQEPSADQEEAIPPPTTAIDAEPSSEEAPLHDDAQQEDSEPIEEDGAQFGEPLFVAGGVAKEGVPAATRHRDFGTSSEDDVIGPYGPPTAPTDSIPGRSMYTSPEAIQAMGMTGQIFEFKGPVPESTAIHRDGADVGGNEPEGHRSLYPTQPMTLREFDQSLREPSRWEHWGKIDKKGNIREAQQDET